MKSAAMHFSMNYYLNPDCQRATKNILNTQFCLFCRANLLLKEQQQNLAEALASGVVDE